MLTRHSRPLVAIACFLGLLVVSGRATGREGTSDYEIIPGTRVGPVAADTNERQLIRQYGKAHVRRERIPIDDEGGAKLGTALFPQSVDELKIVWRDDAFARPRRVLLLRPGSRWKTRDGIGVGTTLKELETVNGGEFEFAAFAWDGAGWITSWLGGRLASQYPTDLIRVRLHAQGLDRLTWQEQESLTGSQRQLRSSDPALGKLWMVIGQIDVMIR
jgi:hypothetical protein